MILKKLIRFLVTSKHIIHNTFSPDKKFNFSIILKLVIFLFFSQTRLMTYYNYHGIARKLIINGHCTHAEFKQKHNSISPALVLYFDNHKPMPIREKLFYKYIALLEFYKVSILNSQQI